MHVCGIYSSYVCVLCVCECNEAGGIQVSLTCRVHVALTRHFMCALPVASAYRPNCHPLIPLHMCGELR